MVGSKPYAKLKSREVNGARMAYVDEGEGDAIAFQQRATATEICDIANSSHWNMATTTQRCRLARGNGRKLPLRIGRRDELPDLPKLLDSLLGRIAGNEGGVDGAD